MIRVTSKYSDWTRGQVEALINIIGEDNARSLLSGELSVSFEGVVKALFDRHGRRIPEGLSANVCDADRKFRFDQPELTKQIHFHDRLERLHRYLSVNTNITSKELQKETGRLLRLICKDTLTANIASGVYLPVVCPKLITNDLGGELEYYLTAAGKSYADVFPKRKFYNHRKGTLDGAVSVIEGSRHGKLIDRMKEEAVIGLYFPNPLQGFSVNASREQEASLPEGFILSGLDAVIAMVMYPDVLARDWSTPEFSLSTLSWQSAEYTLSFFWARDDKLDFGNMALAHAYDSHSGGLLFVG